MLRAPLARGLATAGSVKIAVSGASSPVGKASLKLLASGGMLGAGTKVFSCPRAEGERAGREVGLRPREGGWALVLTRRRRALALAGLPLAAQR